MYTVVHTVVIPVLIYIYLFIYLHTHTCEQYNSNVLASNMLSIYIYIKCILLILYVVDHNCFNTHHVRREKRHHFLGAQLVSARLLGAVGFMMVRLSDEPP